MIASRAMWFGRLAASVCLVALAVLPATAETVNRIVALVDGDPITAHEVRRYGEERRARGASYDDLLEAVITEKILQKEIAARKIVAKPDDVDNYLREVMARNKMTEEQFVKALKQQGGSLEDYKARVKSEMEKTQLVGQELRGESPEVSEDDVRKYYEEHKHQWAQRSAVTVRDIFFAFQPGMTQRDVLRVVEQAKAVKRMADDGQSFDALARRYSQGPGAEQGGLLGTFRRGEMAAPLEQAAFTLPPGEVSSPIVSPQGVHLLKVDSVQHAGAVVPYDEVKDEIRQVLTNQAMDERFRDWIAKNLRTKHHVEVLN
jgi:peptidyl-prolyl cis-trans isomerase SurA